MVEFAAAEELRTSYVNDANLLNVAPPPELQHQQHFPCQHKHPQVEELSTTGRTIATGPSTATKAPATAPAPLRHSADAAHASIVSQRQQQQQKQQQQQIRHSTSSSRPASSQQNSCPEFTEEAAAAAAYVHRCNGALQKDKRRVRSLSSVPLRIAAPLTHIDTLTAASSVQGAPTGHAAAGVAGAEKMRNHYNANRTESAGLIQAAYKPSRRFRMFGQMGERLPSMDPSKRSPCSSHNRIPAGILEVRC